MMLINVNCKMLFTQFTQLGYLIDVVMEQNTTLR